MEKKAEAKQKKTSFGPHPETLPRLDDSQLQRVAGGTRIRIPIGFADDGTPIYGDTAG